jgi:hypothetical protein
LLCRHAAMISSVIGSHSRSYRGLCLMATSCI